MIEFQTTWGWQAALYLFLGGLGAGIFAMAGTLHFLQRKAHRKAVAVSFWTAAVCLAAGLLALISELLKPGRALIMWRSFSSETSWMAFGAWGVALALLVFTAAAFLSTRRTANLLAGAWSSHPGLRDRLRTACVAAGMALALFVAFYTGMLLRGSDGVPFWGSWLLPLLFVVSALSAGANTVAITAVVTGTAQEVPLGVRRAVTLGILCTIAAETLLLALYLKGALSGGVGEFAAQQAAAAFSAEALVSGAYSGPFWVLTVLCGLVAPFLLSAVGCFLNGRAAWAVLAASASFALAGECAMRFLILFAGAHGDFVGSSLVLLV